MPECAQLDNVVISTSLQFLNTIMHSALKIFIMVYITRTDEVQL